MKNKILVGLVIVLMIMNVAILSFLYMGRPKHSVDKREKRARLERPERRIERYLENKLDLNDEQKDKIEKVRHEHIRRTEKHHEEIEKLRKSLSQADDSEVDSLIDRITEYHKQIEKDNYRNMLQIKAQLNPKQKRQFDKIMERVFERAGKRNAKRERQR